MMDVRLRNIRSALPRRELIVGVIASGELLWRAIDGFLLARLAEGVVLPALGSLVVTSVLDITPIARVFNWVLAIAVLYVYTPAIFPTRFREQVTTTGFRLLATLVALSVAFWMETVFSSDRFIGSATFFLPGFLFVLMIVGLVLLLYFGRRQGVGLFDPDNTAIMVPRYMMNASSGEYRSFRETRTRFRGRPWLLRGYKSLLTLVVGGTFGFPLIFFGTIIIIINRFYPLLEVLVLSAVGVRLLSRYGKGEDLLLPDRALDLEDEVYDTISQATNGLKGPMALFVPTIGLAVSSVYFSLALPFLGGFRASISNISSELLDTFEPNMCLANGPCIPEYIYYVNNWHQQPMDVLHLILVKINLVWNSFSNLVIPLTIALYGFWFWFRGVKRVPAFLDAWEAVDSSGTNGPEPPQTSTVRPPWFMLPPALLFFAWWANTYVTLTPPYNDILVAVYAITWPTLLGVTLWTVRLGFTGTPQPPETDNYVLPGALLIQSAGILATDLVPTRWRAALGVMGVLWIYYYPDVVRQSHRKGRPLLDTVYIGLFVVFLLLVSQIVNGPISRLLVVGSIIVLVLLVLLVVNTYLEEDAS